MKFLQTLAEELAAVNLTKTEYLPEEEPCRCCRPLGTLNEDGQRNYVLLRQATKEYNQLAERYNASKDDKERAQLMPQLEMMNQRHAILTGMFNTNIWKQFPEQVGDKLRICTNWQVLPEAQLELGIILASGFGPDMSFDFRSRRGH